MFIQKEHGQAVDAHAKAAVGGHAVAHGPQVILVHWVFLFIVGGIVAAHFEKTLFLVERIVQLGKSIAQFKSSNVSLETLHRHRVAGDGLRQRGDVTRVVVQEGGLDQGRLQEFTEQEVDQLAARRLRVRQLVRMPFLDRPEQVLGGPVGGNVDAAGLEDALAHFQPLPRRCQVDVIVLVGDFLRSQNLLSGIGDHLLGQFHHLQIIRIGPVELKLGEFRVVLERDALVAEITSDLIDLFQIAYEQPLEIQLERDSQVHVLLELVMVGYERTRCCASIQWL